MVLREGHVNIVLCDAIRERRLVRFFYDAYERIIEPYSYGVTHDGRELLMGWLVRGWSSSDTAPGWRTFYVDQMRDVGAMAESFTGPRPSYRGGGNRFARVFCQCPLDASDVLPPSDIARRADDSPTP
jgi:hypothetical protein